MSRFWSRTERIASEFRYWDTSALVKIYAKEPDRNYFLGLVEAALSPLLTSLLTRIEVTFALYRKESFGDISLADTGRAIAARATAVVTTDNRLREASLLAGLGVKPGQAARITGIAC